MLQIRFAKPEDKEAIVRFLQEHWSAQSILVKSRRIFDFQYGRDGGCGFVLAIDDETGEIFGLKGFFPFNHEEHPDIAAALAIVLQGVRPMLGMEIERFLERETCCRWLCSTGLNPQTSVRVYQLFKKQYTVDTLRHYYRLADLPAYQTAKVVRKNIPVPSEGGARLIPIPSAEALDTLFDLNARRENLPYKDAAYLNYRYFHHPVYSYQVYGLLPPGESRARALLIARPCEGGGGRALRIVDYIGGQAAMAAAGPELDRLLAAGGYEYADFYCYGFEDSLLRAAGFSLRDGQDPNIIPNYFEPFLQKNVDIHFFALKAEKMLICKADGDQDRPNILPEGWCE